MLFSKKSYEYGLAWPDYNVERYCGRSPDFKHARCNAGKYYCIIDTNGDVYPCQNLIGNMKPINAAKEGFRKAFDNLDKNTCKACYMPCYNELNLLFGLNPSVVLNHIKNSLKVSL